MEDLAAQNGQGRDSESDDDDDDENRGEGEYLDISPSSSVATSLPATSQPAQPAQPTVSENEGWKESKIGQQEMENANRKEK